MPIIDDSGHRVSIAKPKTKKTTTSPKGYSVGKAYAKPKGSSSLPKWAQEMRAGSDFMPVRVKPASYTALAKAYNASREPYRGSVYAPPLPAASSTVTSLGQSYFKPTADVAKGVVQQHNLWQDIKNMGGTIVHKGGGLLMGALDVLSRPLYAISNVYNDKLQRNYTAADSQGGADVTGWEALKGFVAMATPFGTVKDVVSGDFDDTLKAGWAGLSGKKKTTAFENLETIVPEWVKEHPTGSVAAAVGLNLVFDPLTWLTMGVNPGSIARTGAAGAKLLAADKAAASTLWHETLFTGTGRGAGLKTVKDTIQNKEIKKLTRQRTKVGNKFDKAAAGEKVKIRGKAVTEAQLTDKFVKVSKDLSAKINEDLHGSELAWKVFKKSLPNLGIMTASRFNTGAGASTALKGAEQIKQLSNDFHTGVSEDLAAEDRWQAAFAANRGEDFVYVHDGEKYPVKLSEAKTVQEFVKMVSEESSPLASYAEHGNVAARARKGHIVGVEARGQTFRDQFGRHMEDLMVKALGPKVEKEFDSHRALIRKVNTSEVATKEQLKEGGVINLKESDLLDPNTTYDDIKSLAKKEHENANPNAAFDEGRTYVHYTGVDGKVRRVRLVTLKRGQMNATKSRANRLAYRKAIAERSATVKAVDQMTGVSDNVAGARQTYIEAGNRVRVSREMEEADNATRVMAGEADVSEATRALNKKIFDVVKNSDDFTVAEKAKYSAILYDNSMPMEERLATILRDRSVSNEEADEVLEDLFKIHIDDQGVIHVARGGTIDDIPKIIQAVIRDRFQHRVSDATLQAAGAELRQDELGNLQIAMGSDKSNVAFRRDLNGELGMMILDGYRAAVRYAVENNLYSDPEMLFDKIHTATSDFMTLATADSKRQVIQIMFNATGLRLPEKFTPSFNDISRLVAQKEHIFHTRGQPDPNQRKVWENLARSMQNWALEPLKNIVPIKGLTYVEQGKDIEAVKTALSAKALQIDDPLPNPSANFAKRKELVEETVRLVEDLFDRVNEAMSAGNHSTLSRYSTLDMIIHAEQILKAQTTTVRVAQVRGGKRIGRINAGRLSALDSFTFVDEDAQRGLRALKRLKGMTSSTDPEVAELAKRELAWQYVNAGGLDHLDEIKMPLSGSLEDINFENSFDTLGIHARLKESSLRTGSPIQTGHAAQLLDSMWGNVTVNHELQKSFQNAILHGVWVTGQKEEIVAKQLSESIDNFFKPYDRLKKLIYPVRENALPTKEMIEGGVSPTQRGPREMTAGGIKGARRRAQEGFGNNPLIAHRNAPMIDVEDPALLSFKNAKGETLDISHVKLGNVNNSILSVESAPVETFLRKKRGFNDSMMKVVKQGFTKIGEITVRDIKVDGELKGVFIRVDGVDGATPTHKDLYFGVKGTGVGDKKPIVLTGRTADKPRDLKTVIRDAFTPGETTREQHLPVHDPDEYTPRALLQKKLEYTAPTPKPGAGITAEQADDLIRLSSELKAAEGVLSNAIARSKNAPKGDPAARADLAKAHAEYVRVRDETNAAKQAAPEPVPAGVGAEGASATPTPTAAGAGEATATAGTPPTPEPEFANIADYTYTDEEIDAIRGFIGVTDAANNPEAVATTLHAHSMAIADDVMSAQAKMISDLADFNIKYGGRVKFMGIPFMPIAQPMNGSHTMAGVVAFEQDLGNIRKFFSQTVVGNLKKSDRGAMLYRKLSRPSHYLEGSLERIRTQVVNFASEGRKQVIHDLEGFYGRALGSEYNIPQFAGMSRKQKFAYIRKQMFLPSQKGVPDAIEQFNLADGTNPVNDIVANFHENAAAIFDPLKPDTWGDQLELFNRYMLKKYRLTDDQLIAVQRSMKEPGSPLENLMPYSREWLQQVGKVAPASPFTTDKLLKINLGELHYAMQDTKLKIHSGTALNRGVFGQFAFHADIEHVNMHNGKVIPGTVDANGKQLRGEWISVDKIGADTEWNIASRHIPKEYLGNNYYISADYLPEVKTMFDYMDEVSQLNETINVGLMDKIMQYFKASVTIYKVPSYPVRNLISDVMMSAFDGLTHPGYYKDSARLIMDHHKAMKEIDTQAYQGIFDGGFLNKETLKGAHDPSSVLTPANTPVTPFSRTFKTAQGDVTMNGAQIMEAFNLMGIGQNRTAGDVVEIMHGARQGKGAALGRVHDALRNFNDVREDFARLAHFLYALEREAPLGGNFEEIMRRASTRVIKHHFDYNDVSIWERNVLGKYIPFYKWMRNIIPYTISTVITKPVALKAENALNTVVGFLVDDDLDDNRTDYVIPEWIEYDNAVAVGSFTDDNNNQFGQYMSLSMPLSDTLKRTLGPMFNPIIEPSIEGPMNKFVKAGEGVAQVLGAAGNPVVKAGVQAATGQEMWPTGPKPQGQDNWLGTLSTAAPGVPAWNSLQTALEDLGSSDASNMRAFGLEQLGLINLHFNRENYQLGELNQREDFYRNQLNKAKTDMMNQLQKNYPNSTPDQRKQMVDLILKKTREAPDSGRISLRGANG